MTFPVKCLRHGWPGRYTENWTAHWAGRARGLILENVSMRMLPCGSLTGPALLSLGAGQASLRAAVGCHLVWCVLRGDALGLSLQRLSLFLVTAGFLCF